MIQQILDKILILVNVLLLCYGVYIGDEVGTICVFIIFLAHLIMCHFDS